MATSSLLGLAERLTLVNSALSSLPTYTMYTLKLPKKVSEVIDMARRNCLWRGLDGSAKDKALVAWKRVCAPKDKDGLRVLNLGLQNKALLLKHLHKFYNKVDNPLGQSDLEHSLQEWQESLMLLQLKVRSGGSIS